MGKICIYAPSSKPTRADLAQIVEMLQDRLDRAEAYIASQCHNFQRNSVSGSHADSAHDSAVAMENPDTYLAMSNIGGDNQDDGTQLQLENLMAATTPQHRSSSVRPGDGIGRTGLPSLQEIRALNTDSLSRPGTAKVVNYRSNESEECTKVLDSVSEFSLSIFAAHAEMAGVASVVAEYLAWARKAPPRLDSAQILEILEARLRELHQMAESSHRAAWQHTTSTLENMSRATAQFKAVEEEMQNRTVRISRFFDGKYDVSVPLSEQRVWDDEP
ncbi:hypothetical protein F4818DRAFT_5335 [Hypoxylon cercidicola]|nr:hypothetical protein F4818DRAFT_5335 [Hypoxylon cercidicola]